jgi:hypothetical protein
MVTIQVKRLGDVITGKRLHPAPRGERADLKDIIRFPLDR